MTAPFNHNRPIKKTRKRHLCTWCGEFIPAGSASQYHTGYWEDFYHGHLHPECHAAWERADADLLCEGWSPGDFKRGSTESAI